MLIFFFTKKVVNWLYIYHVSSLHCTYYYVFQQLLGSFFISMISTMHYFKNIFYFSDSPICGFGEPRVVGVAMMETVDLVCDVVSNPNRLVFHWNLNKSIDGDPLTTFAHNGTR